MISDPVKAALLGSNAGIILEEPGSAAALAVDVDNINSGNMAPVATPTKAGRLHGQMSDHSRAVACISFSNMPKA